MKGKRLEFRRHLEYEKVNIKDIKVEPGFVEDDKFVKMYANYIAGKTTAAWTRVDIDNITPGFFVRDASGKISNIRNKPSANYIDLFSNNIMMGERPSLILYRSPFHGDDDNFVCPDDEITYEAYRKLRIKKVPCLILGRNFGRLSESAIVVRTKKGSGLILHTTLAAKNEFYQSIIDPDGNMPLASSLMLLSQAVAKAKEAIKLFHNADRCSVHYHHTLYSICQRHEETVNIISNLIEKNHIFQAMTLVRLLYEAFLNFYIDWLCPHQIGPILQLLSMVRRHEIDNLSGRGSSTNRIDIAGIDKILGGFSDFCQVVERKARISPMGLHFHNYVYSHLSLVAHQDFGITEEYGGILDEIPPYSDIGELPRKLILWISIITTELVTRVMDDVGANDKFCDLASLSMKTRTHS